MKKTLIAAIAGAGIVFAAGSAWAAASVTFSEVYGAGGNSGATYNTDFVELHNTTASPIDISGWSLQCGSATGTTINSGTGTFPALTSIPASGYLLVATGAVSGTNGVALPTTADLTLSGVTMAATASKIFLVNNATTLSASNNATAAGVVDMVGFGATANTFEGSAAAPAPSTTTSLFRAAFGNTDTDQNGSDFTASSVSTTRAPRNSTFASVTDWSMIQD